jgi:hypothetical protein
MEAIDEIKNPEIKAAVETLQAAREALEQSKSDDNTIEIIEAAERGIMEDVSKHSCGQCASYMAGLGSKMRFLAEQCRDDPISCAIETKQTQQRIDEMEQTFREVDSDLAIDGKEQEIAGEDIEIPVRTYRDDFHACTSQLLGSGEIELTGGETGSDAQRMKVCIASKMCSKAKTTKEEAMEICKKT